MAAIYQPRRWGDFWVTTTPYPVEVTESVVFGMRISSARMDILPRADASGTFGPGNDGVLEQLRWFLTDGPYENEVAGTFGVGDDGTLEQLRWFLTDGPYPDEVSGTFGPGNDGLLEQIIIIVEADTPDESLQFGVAISNTCSMDAV